MKKINLYLFSGLLIFVSCTKVSNRNLEETTKQQPVTESRLGRTCGAMDVFQNNLAHNPNLSKRMNDIEKFTARIMTSPDAARLLPDGTIEIPVVINVLYKLAAENISAAQIQSQIDVLNEDFKALNTD